MTTTEKLKLIRARCVELLAIAEKRTPGKWESPLYGVRGPDKTLLCDAGARDAAFIAACAGAAEAGWRATIAAIDGLLGVIESDISADPYEACNHHEQANAAIAAIIAAWEWVL